MIGKLKAMLGFTSKKAPKPDPISAQMAIATQRNQAAGLEARMLLEEMLARNDGLRGSKQ